MISLGELAVLVKDSLVIRFSTEDYRIIKSWRPIRKPEELLRTTISVLPVAQASSLDTRVSTTEVYRVVLLLQGKLPATGADEVADTFDGLADDIMKLFRLTTLLDDTGRVVAYVTMVERTTVFSTEHFDALRVFTSEVSLELTTVGEKYEPPV